VCEEGSRSGRLEEGGRNGTRGGESEDGENDAGKCREGGSREEIDVKRGRELDLT